jgi:RNA polymerase sigma factor (sigma-70 family)
MARAPTQAEDDPPAAQRRRELLGASIEENYGHLCASAAAVILNSHRGIKEQQLIDLAEDVVHEAIGRALTKAAQYDSSRRAVPWLMQFILNVLKEWDRHEQRQPRQSDLGDLAWDALLGGLSCHESSSDITKQMPRLDQALASISSEQREILLLRFKSGLDGAELARAVGAPSAGAARVRLHRALAALRQEFSTSADQEELNP